MLAKVITLAHGRAGNGFGSVLRYLLRVDHRKESPSRPTPESGHLHLTQEPYWSAAEDAREYAQDVAAVFDDQARQCRGRGRFSGNPVYHVAINWMEGEHPTLQQAERASRHVMRALGFEACQGVFAIHRDTGNDHVHLVINRVHPVKLTAVSVPWGDYYLLDRCMRELELELGCARAQGPYVTVDTADGPKIVRMSHVERAARGLLQNPESPRISSRAQRAEQNLAAESFQRWLTGAPSVALHRATAGDQSVNFTTLRSLYPFMDQWDPYGNKTTALLSQAAAAFRGKDCATAFEKLDEVLKMDFTIDTAHALRSECLAEAGRQPAAKIESNIADGLVDSLMHSGDGNTEGSAYVVVTQREEMDVLANRHLVFKGRGTQIRGSNGHLYDVIQAALGRDDEGVENVYFDVGSFVNGRESRMAAIETLESSMP